MIEIILLVSVVFVLAFVLGWKFRGWILHKYIELLIKPVRDVKHRDREPVIFIRIKRDQGCYYVYNLENGSFICQGNSRKELEDTLRSKYPDKSLAVKESNLVDLGW